MATGILLIAAGLGLFATAKAYFDVADAVNKFRAKEMQTRQVHRWFTALGEVNARWGRGRAFG